MERMALMLELEGWVREAQDRLDAELGAVMSVGREQRSYLKKASTSQQCHNPQKKLNMKKIITLKYCRKSNMKKITLFQCRD